MASKKKSFSNEIMGYALKNAIEYGKADAGKIMPKLFNHGLEKDMIKEIMPEIISKVTEVNKLSEEGKEIAFENYKEYIKINEDCSKKLTPLKNPSKHMVFRLAPYPSGAMHIGNAKTYLLNAIYAEHYKGKILFVMDDTIGSEEKHLVPEGYKLLEECVRLLGVKYKKPIIYKSDRLKIYYKYAVELIKKDKAYVCHCSAEKIRENRANGIECGCRKFPQGIHLARWKEMFKMSDGEAVLRLKTSMTHPNPAFRDRVLFKISTRKHPRKKNKYRVWPSLEMSWAIDDHLLGITHIIRGNDLMMETEVEKFIWDIFKWKHPEVNHVALVRLSGVGAKISKSKAQKEVKSGEFMGWDDPRTWSIQSLIRRGITKEAIRDFVEEIGLNNQDIIVPIDNLYAANRKRIDAKAERYSFVKEPMMLLFDKPYKIKEVEVPIHPDTPNKTRKIKLPQIIIDGDDFQNYKGKEVRLIHLFNIKIENKEKTRVTSVENKKIPKIQWVSDEVPCRVLMPDGKWVLGMAESGIKRLKKGQIIQFERFGFVRFDTKAKDAYEFWFAHR
jgi:glutamyl-tRNA synthetase